MGNDLLISTLAIPTGNRPDWNAARELALRMPEEQFAEAIENLNGEVPYDEITGETDIDECRRRLVQLVNDVAEATESEHRHLYASEYVVPGWTVWVTGGDSWGDSPSEEFDLFNAFLSAGFPGDTLAQAAGFAYHFVTPDSQDPEKGD